MAGLRLRRWTLVPLMLAVALAVAACGSSSSSSSTPSSTAAASTTSNTTSSTSSGSSLPDSAGIAAAKAAVAAARKPPTFNPMAPAFNASKARGKTVWIIDDNSQLPFAQEITQGLQEAAKPAGIILHDCLDQGTVGEWVACFNQAIAAKPALILLNGSPSPSQLQPQIKQANAAGIPVVANHVPLQSQFPKGTLPATNTTGLAGIEAGPFVKAAHLMADYALANQPNGKVNALIITANEAPASVGIVKMIQSELASKCGSSCKTTVLNVPIVDWATKMQSATQSALLANPSINWVIPIYDGMYEYVVPAITGANRANSVKTVSYNGQIPALKMIEEHKVTATMGEDLVWTGWSTMDQILRILALGKAAPVTQANTPIRVWDSSNISQVGNPPQEDKGYGTAYKTDYLKLWGLKH